MTAVFPQAPIGVDVELYLGSWTSIVNPTAYVYQRDPIHITRGRADESSQVNPSQCTLTLDNRDNRFSINNPTSPYYGLLGRNTPLRVSIPNSLLPAPANTTYLRIEDDAASGASTPAVAAIELTGSLDVRLDVDPSGFGVMALASIWGASAAVNQRSWCFGVVDDGTLFFMFSSDGTNIANVLVSDTRLPVGIGRQSLRAVLDAATGNVTFYTGAPGVADTGPWTQLGSAVLGFGAVSVFASTTQPLAVGVSPGLAYDYATSTLPFGLSLSAIALQGAVYDMELRNASGTVVAHPSFNTQAAGATTWTDPKSLVWSLTGTAVLSNRDYRYHGELAQTPKAADPTATDVYSQATSSGVLRRLGQGQSPLDSALYRAYVRQTGSGAPVAYWPCEDAAGATRLASGLSGGSPLQVSGAPQLASNSQVVSSAPLPVLNGSAWRGPVPQAGTWSVNQIELVVAFPSSASGETNGEVIASLYSTGTVARVDLQYGTGGTGSVALLGYNSAGTQVFSSGPIAPTGSLNGGYFSFTFGVYPASGGNVEWQISMWGPDTVYVPTNGTVSGQLGKVTSVAVNPAGACKQLTVGHVAVQQAADVGVFQAFNAWVGETAGARVQRLCTEEGVQARIVGHPGLSIQMGPQTIKTLSALLQECETTDRGFLFEPRTCLGIGYRTLRSMYNQQPVASAAYNQGMLDQGFSSTADDQLTVNDVTASNADGSSARQVLTSGAMSVQAPPNGIGRVDTQIQVNALTDGYLPNIAQWVLHACTDRHDRFPLIPFNLARAQTPRALALADIGDLCAVTGVPPWLQPDEIDQIAAGFEETLGPFAVWQITANGIPAYPYTIAQVAGAGGVATHVDTDGSQLAAGVSATATSLSVSTVAGAALWTTSAGDFPFDIQVSGERMTVTNITGSSSPQAFTVTRSVNGVVKLQSAGAALSLWYTPIIGL